MEELFDDNEYNFLDHINDTCRASLIVGIKGSGKTALMLNLFKFIFMNQKANDYKYFHLVIPNYSIEQNDTYRFIKDIKHNKNIFIYNKYNDIVVEMVYQKQLKSNDGKSLFIIDDATGDFMKSFHNNAGNMVKILTDARHLKISLFIIAHHITGALKPVYRSMFDYVFLFNISNGKLLKSCYDEFISLNDDKSDYNGFKKEFNDKVKKVKYAFLLIDNIVNNHSFNNPDSWTLNKLTDINNLDDYI